MEGETMPKDERENRRGTVRDINAGKGRWLTVIMGWEAITETV